jgi:hypothetical protein
MIQVELGSWDELVEELAKLETQREERKSRSKTHVSDLLFRGQSDSSWPLRTTLERATEEEVAVEDYLRLIYVLSPEIEAHTGRSWGLPEWPDLRAQEVKPFAIPRPPVVYEYMAYLRHHGFPSPLLDWTDSPFLAAYFAFRERQHPAERVAIYAYLEYTGGGKGGWASDPQIVSLGPTVRTHARHFLQRSQYTLCSKEVENRGHLYWPHEAAFERDERDQDLLWKFTIPTSERTRVLIHLDRFNISSFSLFGSEKLY